MINDKAQQAAIRADNVWKRAGDLAILRGITTTIAPGEICVVVGRSGAGKSTFLRCINGLEDYDYGRLYVGDELVSYREVGDQLQELTDKERAKARRRTGMVFQSFNLFGSMNALDNVALAPKHVMGMDKARAEEVAYEKLQQVGMKEKAGRYPVQLSGGEQQRVGIARALALEPDVLLLDEITSALDPSLVREVQDVVRGLKDRGMTMIAVTHDMKFAAEIADRVLVMDGGTIVEDGGAELLAKF